MALRHEAIEALEKGDANIIVATDVLARGMDLKNISHVRLFFSSSVVSLVCVTPSKLSKSLLFLNSYT
jgi:late competence protein required for DNA uptake (superfamily II DNA/RNA helicase)